VKLSQCSRLFNARYSRGQIDKWATFVSYVPGLPCQRPQRCTSGLHRTGLEHKTVFYDTDAKLIKKKTLMCAKNETHVILNILYSCKTIAMKFST